MDKFLSVWFSDAYSVQPVPLKVFHLPRRTPIAVKNEPILCSSQPLAWQPLIHSVSMDLPGRYFIYKESYNMWFFVSFTKRVFKVHLSYIYGMYQYFVCFLWLNANPLYGYTTVYLFTCWWTFWLLWIVLLRTFVNRYLFEYLFLVLLGM